MKNLNEINEAKICVRISERKSIKKVHYPFSCFLITSISSTEISFFPSSGLEKNTFYLYIHIYPRDTLTDIMEIASKAQWSCIFFLKKDFDGKYKEIFFVRMMNGGIFIQCNFIIKYEKYQRNSFEGIKVYENLRFSASRERKTMWPMYTMYWYHIIYRIRNKKNLFKYNLNCMYRLRMFYHYLGNSNSNRLFRTRFSINERNKRNKKILFRGKCHLVLSLIHNWKNFNYLMWIC